LSCLGEYFSYNLIVGYFVVVLCGMDVFILL